MHGGSITQKREKKNIKPHFIYTIIRWNEWEEKEREMKIEKMFNRLKRALQ